MPAWAARATSAIRVRPAGIGSQRWKPGVLDTTGSQSARTSSAIALRRAASARFNRTRRCKSPLWISRVTTSAMIGEAIHPVEHAWR